jgi:2-polyprenyl-3-methyl-5-hydroxy-6-metoxy-1,4-benzoquinol methylase
MNCETLSVCPVCGQSDYRVQYKPDVCKCRSCKILFRNPRPTQEDIARYYNNGHTYDVWHQEKNAENWDNLWTRRLQFVRRFKSLGRHLDIGAGDGKFLSKTKEAGFTVIGTELSEKGSAFIRQLGIDVRLGQFVEITLPDREYDLITLWHVLEHVPDPGAVMARVRKIIASDGVLVIAVPNEDHSIWRNRLMPWRYPTGFGPITSGAEIHLTHFQPSTLKRLLRAYQFRVAYFGVDDSYRDRSFLKRIKIGFYATLARLTGWHPAVAMVAVGRPLE